MLTIAEIVQATRGRLIQGRLSANIHGVSINSRTVKKGDLFVAIIGERFDAHAFIAQAVKKGARAVVVSKKVVCGPSVTVVRVDDTTRALGFMALHYRKKFPIPLVAVTGSAGKTTTKELIAAVLKKRYRVLKNIKTENNQFGVPLTLLKLRKSHNIAVLELGTNQFGDIRWLSRIARPTVCVFTNIGDSHLQGLKTRAGVFKEKFRMIQGLNRKDCVIYNKDDDYLSTIAQSKITPKKISYGLNDNSDFRAKSIRLRQNRLTEFSVDGKRFQLKTPAKHNIYNALAAIVCGRLFKVNFSDIQKAVGQYAFGLNRQEIKKIGSLLIIDDTYNSNPVSFKSAIETLNSLELKGRKILVCADMLELGGRARSLHEDMGKLVAKSKVHLVLTMGPYARFLKDTIGRMHGRIQSYHCGSLEEIHRRLKNFCRPGDVLLVKGSRAMKMERTVAFLTKHFNPNLN